MKSTVVINVKIFYKIIPCLYLIIEIERIRSMIGNALHNLGNKPTKIRIRRLSDGIAVRCLVT